MGEEPAPVSRRVTYRVVVPFAKTRGIMWRYTVQQPAGEWYKSEFDDSSWKQGQAGFGTRGTPGAIVRTRWDNDDIWLRRTFDLHGTKPDDLSLIVHHDEDAEIYLNGILAAKLPGFVTDYQPAPISAEAKAALKDGQNLLAIHCHQTTGGQYIDVGLVQMLRTTSNAFFPPAVPLVTHDPYFSIWSESDRLADDWSKHWTGADHSLTSIIRIDGKPYRLMGMPDSNVPALEQDKLDVLPTRSIYHFSGAGVGVTLTFLSPLLPDDLDVLTRPLTYITWDVMATDGKPHQVGLYFDNSSQLVVNDEAQQVTWSQPQVQGLRVLWMGNESNPVLKRKGDGVRIDWGYVFSAARAGQSKAAVCTANAARDAFARDGSLGQADSHMPRAVNDGQPVSAFVFDLGQVAAEPVSRTLMLAYDELFAIQLMGTPLRPYWRHAGMEPAQLLQTAAKQFDDVRERCEKFDRELMDDLSKAGGDNYARIGALAYRQALAGCGYAAGEHGEPLVFTKENTSNGCISTVDVQYPACPLFLLFSPTLMEGHLTPVFEYAESPRWRFPFAPHDLGTYPHANGQVYGGGERTEKDQMPVEESGNMILMTAGICQARGNAAYAQKHWDALTKWAAYLKDKGFDPENQLCTDDFAGHLAHNVNLSAKAIVALGAYAMMAEKLSKHEQANEYRKLAEQFAQRWVKDADDGDHYRLAFDRAGTWSQKYNIVWDRILDLKLFPPHVLDKEFAYYRKVQHEYGLPLDNRKDYTKTDWLLWTATLGSPEDFSALTTPVVRFLADTPDRVPFSDFYYTSTAKDSGMHARPVIGGVFIKLLNDEVMWKKWAGRAK